VGGGVATGAQSSQSSPDDMVKSIRTVILSLRGSLSYFPKKR